MPAREDSSFRASTFSGTDDDSRISPTSPPPDRRRLHCGLNPLDTLASLIRAGPASPRARVLLRALVALREGAGQFEESDLWTLDAEAQHLLTALLNDRLAGRYSDTDFDAVLKVLRDCRTG